MPAIFYVNTLDDTSDFNLGDNIPSDANGNTSLRSAIEQSNATGNGVVSVEFDIGLVDANNEIILTLTKSLGITTKISIDGNYGHSKFTTIKGTGGFSPFVNEAIGTAFSNMVFQGNDAGKNNNSGAIQNKSHLTVDTCEFVGNKSGKGGAIANNADGILTIGDSTFTFNSTNNEGGAIYAADSSHVEIYWTTFTENSAVKGGALASNNAATLIDNLYFYLNFAGDGGASYMSEGGLEISSSSFVENGAITNGGALLISRDCIVQIDDTDFKGNISQNGDGGAIFLDISALTLNNCVFESNIAYSGKGHCVRIVGILNTTVWFTHAGCTYQNNNNDILN